MHDAGDDLSPAAPLPERGTTMTESTRTTAAPAPNGADIVELWDAGKSFFTVEMGGLGPGYEQAIQVAMVEIVRDHLGQPLPEPGSKEIDEFGYATIAKHDAKIGGMSGAQAGAARSLAYRILRDGHAATIASMREHDKERLIQVSNRWPTVAP